MATYKVSDRYSVSKSNVQKKYSSICRIDDINQGKKGEPLSLSRKKVNPQQFQRKLLNLKEEIVDWEQESEFGMTKTNNNREKKKTIKAALQQKISTLDELYHLGMELKTQYQDVIEENVRLHSKIGILMEEKQELMKAMVELKKQDASIAERTIDKMILSQKYKRVLRKFREDNQFLRFQNQKMQNYILHPQFSMQQLINKKLLKQKAKLRQNIKKKEITIKNQIKNTEEKRYQKLREDSREHLFNLIKENMEVRDSFILATKKIEKMEKRIYQLQRQSVPTSDKKIQCNADIEQYKVGTDELDFDLPIDPQFAELRRALKVVKITEGGKKQFRCADYNSFVWYFRSKMAYENITSEMLINELSKAEVDTFSEKDLRTILSFKPFCLHPRDQSLFLCHLFKQNKNNIFPKQDVLKYFEYLMQGVITPNESKQRKALETLFSTIQQSGEKQNFQQLLELENIFLRKLDKFFGKLKLDQEDRKHLRNMLVKGARCSEEINLKSLRQSYEKGIERSTPARLTDPPVLQQSVHQLSFPQLGIDIGNEQS